VVANVSQYDSVDTRITVLVVDDSEFFANMTAEKLTEEHGLDAEPFYDPTEVLEYLETNSADCVVSDYEMPEMDGLEMLNEVRSEWEELPFILLTGRGDEEVASEAIAAGVADYLLKLEVIEDEQYGRLANRIANVVSQHRAQKKYELLFDNSPDIIAQVTDAGEIVTANPALAEFAGLDRDELVGETLTSLFGEEGASITETGTEVVATGEHVKTQTEIDGTHLHNHFVPVQIQGEPDSFQLLSRDVTEQIHRQEELERQNTRLEEFATVVSHDMRNPLHVAKSTIDLVSEDVEADDPVDPELVARVGRSLERMETLIDDVLTLARQGQTVDNPDGADLRELAKETWGLIGTNEATLEVASSKSIHADSSRLKDILSNLFVNAVDHNDESVTVTVGVVDEHGVKGFYVADDGSGIDNEDAAEIFDLGYTTEQRGTGMGLTIVKRIAEAHGWDIQITDNSDGLRFDITGVTFQE
jgi:PAS domain S-box-containing protein